MKEERAGVRLYSLEDAARQLGVSVWTLRSHQKKGSLRTTRVGRRVLVSALELERISVAGLPTLAAVKLPSLRAEKETK